MRGALFSSFVVVGILIGTAGCSESKDDTTRRAGSKESTTSTSNGSQGTGNNDKEAPPPMPAPLPQLPGAGQARTLLGDVREPLELQDEVAQKRRDELATAQAEYDRNPDQLDSIIWLGRRFAYLGEYRRGVELFTEAAQKHPSRPEPFRHRGHRYLTLRLFDAAVADLEHAARLALAVEDCMEPDGLPNAAGTPISSLHFNIWYHLGLAHYFRHDFNKASQVFSHCVGVATTHNDDQLVAAVYWLYHCLVRTGRTESLDQLLAPIRADLELLENHTYLSLLLLYKGERTVKQLEAQSPTDNIQNATLAYGLARWYDKNGSKETAIRRLTQIVEKAAWPAFGVIAAESDVFVHRNPPK